jgi:MoaA/NifB/PqqE/SkfB family radical SAM enzyme
MGIKRPKWQKRSIMKQKYRAIRASKYAYDYIDKLAKEGRRSFTVTLDMIIEKVDKKNRKQGVAEQP